MRLVDLWIDGFGKLNNVWMGFSDGTNIITGLNEAGKSTVYACIRAMFYGMTRAKGVAALTDTYSHYKPWFAKNYGARLRVEKDGHIYSIKRDFLKDPTGCSVFDETVSEAVPYADRFVAELLLNISEEAYDNTISISRLFGDKDGSLGAELKKYIVNMDTTGSHALNCARARAYLNDQKRRLAERISPEASKEYALNCSEIKRLEKSIREYEAEAGAAHKAQAADVKASAAAAAAASVAVAEETEAEAEEREKAAKAEAAAEAAKAAKDESDELHTELQCLDADIIAAREKLRSHSVYSSEQVAKAKAEFEEELTKYRKGSGKVATGLFRVLYIVFYALALIDIFAIAYICGSNFTMGLFVGTLLIGIILLILGTVFLILCILFKNNTSRKNQAFGKILESYTGYTDITDERIERVEAKLDELMKLAKDAEEKAAELAELSKKVGNADAAAAEADALLQTAVAAKAAAAAQVAAGVQEEASAQETAASGASVQETENGENSQISHPQPQNNIVNELINKVNGIKARNIDLKALLKKNDAINEELDAIDMALEKMDELGDTMKDSLGVHLNAKASQYINEITAGAYDSLSVDDDLNVFMNTKDRMVPLEQLSNGTADQIYMALRFAGARLLQNGEDRLPLIFDDSFVNYDDERLEATLTWLVREYGGQVLIFSCHDREGDLLRENGLTFNPIHL